MHMRSVVKNDRCRSTNLTDTLTLNLILMSTSSETHSSWLLQTTSDKIFGLLKCAIAMTLSDLQGHLAILCPQWMYFTILISL